MWHLGLGIVIQHNGYLWAFSVQSHSWVILCTYRYLKMACIWKTAGRRVKQTESGSVETYICCTFDLLVFKFILGPFGALVSKWPVTVTRKQHSIKWNRLKMGPYDINKIWMGWIWPCIFGLLFRFSYMTMRLLLLSVLSSRASRSIWPLFNFI